jgi:hypothetical protein
MNDNQLNDKELSTLKRSMGQLNGAVKKILYRILIPRATYELNLTGARCNTAGGQFHDKKHGCNMAEVDKSDANMILILHHDHVSQMREPWIQCTNPGYTARNQNRCPPRNNQQYSVLKHSCSDLAITNSRLQWEMGQSNYLRIREFVRGENGVPRATLTDVFMVTPSILITLRALQMLNKIVFDEKCGTQSGLRKKLINRYHDVMENVMERHPSITEEHHTSQLITEFLASCIVKSKVTTVIFRRLWWTQWVYSAGM